MRSGGDAPNAVRPIPNTLKGHEQSDFAKPKGATSDSPMATSASATYFAAEQNPEVERTAEGLDLHPWQHGRNQAGTQEQRREGIETR
jgi:hypothetical protein